MTAPSSKPVGYENDLGEYGPCLFDAHCGEPVAWGFKLIRQLGQERFEHLRHIAALEYSGGDWFVITRYLTRAEAIQLYGAVSTEEFGPNGGWKSVRFGERTFCYQRLKTDISQSPKPSQTSRPLRSTKAERTLLLAELRRISTSLNRLKPETPFECCKSAGQVCVHQWTKDIAAELAHIVEHGDPASSYINKKFVRLNRF